MVDDTFSQLILSDDAVRVLGLEDDYFNIELTKAEMTTVNGHLVDWVRAGGGWAGTLAEFPK